MELKTLQLRGNRRLRPVATKCVIAAMVILCAIGIASAGNETTITIYTDDDMKDWQTMIDNTDIGIIFAGIAWVGRFAPIIVIILLGALAVVARMANDAEKHKWALQGMFWIIIILFVMTIALGFITRSTPDISTITFGG